MILVLLMGITTGGLAARDQWKGTIAKEGGVTVVKNPKEPISEDPALSLKQDFALGGPDATGDSAFNQIRTAAIGDDGSIYVLDGKECHVKIFDRSGKYIRTFSQKGQGPGELSLPTMMSLNRARREIMIVDRARRLLFFGYDGRFIRQQLLAGIIGVRAGVDSNGNIVITEGVLDPRNLRYQTKRYDPDLKLLADFAESPAPTSGAFNPFMAFSSWAIDNSDNVVYGYPNAYELQIFSGSNVKVKKILKEYDPVEITEEEKEEKRKTYSRDAEEGMKIVFEKYHPAYKGFFLSDTGHVLVETLEKTKDEKSIHDIFDNEGRYLARMPLTPSGIEIRDGKYYAIETDAEGYQILKRYSVEWKIK